MPKTIKQIADEIGVSKTAVRQKLKQEFPVGFREQTKEVSGVIYIDEKLENLIKQRFLETKNKSATGNQKPETSGNQFPQASGEVSGSLQIVIELLKEQLEVKDKQIAERDKHIGKLQAEKDEWKLAFQTEQALHAGTITKQITDTSRSEDVDIPIESSVVQSQRMGIFDKINNFFKPKKHP